MPRRVERVILGAHAPALGLALARSDRVLDSIARATDQTGTLLLAVTVGIDEMADARR
jgi:hypothetical protein